MLAILPARIEQKVGDRSNFLKIGHVGQFAANYLIGMDGKTPVVVENNWSWNIRHGIKARTRQMRYRDAYGNQFEYTGTNSNQGKFTWTDTTPIYYR